MSRDLYANRDARLDTVVGDGKDYWRRLSRAAEEWTEQNPRHWMGVRNDPVGFNDWLQEHYGFRTVYDETGGITGQPDIRDDQKYLVFLLKYGG